MGGQQVLEVDWDGLRAAARSMIAYAYVPYSRYPVGAAALVDDGRVVTGCNVENASYGVTLCAECGLVSSLAATGGGRLVAFACVDGHGAALMPCGRCRQLLWEHGGPELMVDTPEGILPMTAVLPQAFGPDHLLSRQGENPLEPPPGVAMSGPLTRPNDYGA
jgi:cytidine deaminase